MNIPTMHCNIPQCIAISSHLEDCSNLASLSFNCAILSSYLLKKSIPFTKLSDFCDSFSVWLSDTMESMCLLSLLWMDILDNFLSYVKSCEPDELFERSLPARGWTSSPFTISQSSLIMWLFSGVTGTKMCSRKNKLSFVHNLFSLFITSTWKQKRAVSWGHP